MNQKEYDVVVLGGSEAGIETALQAAENGLKTAIIEENEMGGSHFRTSEKPIELLQKNNEIIKECLNSTKNGLVFSDVSFNPDQFFDQIDLEADKKSKEEVERLRRSGVDIFIGHGIARPDKTVAIIREDTNTRVINWKNLVYAGEPVSSIPPIIRQHASNYYTSSNIGLLDHVPNGLIIFGSGKKAVSIADIWSNLGAQVYLISPNKRVVSELPEDIEKLVLESLGEQGVKILTNVDVLDLYQDSGGDYHFEVVENDKNNQERIIGSELVILTKEGTSLVGIEALNIAQEDGWIKTDGKLKTSIDNIYTWTGSVNNKRSAESDKAAARYLGKLLSGKTEEDFSFETPKVIFSFHPDYAESGVTQTGDNILCGEYRDGDEFLRLFIDPEFGEIVGAQSYHKQAKELIDLIEFLKNLEISTNDLVDIDSSNALNEIIIKAAKDVDRQL